MSDPATDFPLISLEEKALKAKLQGLTVYDLKNNARPVQVFFRNPQKEIIESDFPFLTIYFTGLVRATDREHRTQPGVMSYLPHPMTGADLDGTEDTHLMAWEQAIPFDLNFTIATHARTPMHDRQIIDGLLGINYLPLRMGWLECEDNTIRRLDVSPRIMTADFYDQSGSQVFRKEFSITVSSEKYLLQPEEVRQVDTVTTTLVEDVE